MDAEEYLGCKPAWKAWLLLSINLSKTEMKHGLESPLIRQAELDDVKALVELENQCFTTDRLSQRSFKRHLQSDHSDLLVAYESSAATESKLLAYGLSLRHKGTRLARLYSLAVSPAARGMGMAGRLLNNLEHIAAERGRFYMRLEVAKTNHAAIKLYESNGYRIFGEYHDYYENHDDALRMQKRIRQMEHDGLRNLTPWYQQSTEFTCGPAALMMAMASLDSEYQCDRTQEVAIWREATTIFMTSGHGGCHPLGLAIAAQHRGFRADVWLNTEEVLFIDGVRSQNKKEVMTLVHEQFMQECHQLDVGIHYQEVYQNQLQQWLEQGSAVLILISTYRLDGRKAPHWVVVTGIDEHCLYVHDPDVDQNQLPIDCQYVPIAHEDVSKMSVFGRERVRMVLVLSKDTHQ